MIAIDVTFARFTSFFSSASKAAVRAALMSDSFSFSASSPPIHLTNLVRALSSLFDSLIWYFGSSWIAFGNEIFSGSGLGKDINSDSAAGGGSGGRVGSGKIGAGGIDGWVNRCKGLGSGMDILRIDVEERPLRPLIGGILLRGIVLEVGKSFGRSFFLARSRNSGVCAATDCINPHPHARTMRGDRIAGLFFQFFVIAFNFLPNSLTDQVVRKSDEILTIYPKQN